MKKLLTLLVCALIAQNTYYLFGHITEFDYEEDVVTVEDHDGNLWQFEGIEDWEIGDRCLLLMYTNGTDVAEDDAIVRATYIEEDEEEFNKGYYYGIQHVINDSVIYTTERYNPDDPEASEWNGFNQRILIVVDDITYEVGMHQC